MHSGAKIPINHGEGNYFAPDDVLDRLERDRRVIFRYVDAASGEPTSAANPNGAARNIAGICSERRNVVGMMPHPERVQRNAQLSWTSGATEEASPWLRMFRNARVWVG